MEWWTRLRPIRTLSEIRLEFEAYIGESHQYQRFAEEIYRLRSQGMTIRAIARSLGLEPKTVKRGLSWHTGPGTLN